MNLLLILDWWNILQRQFEYNCLVTNLTNIKILNIKNPHFSGTRYKICSLQPQVQNFENKSDVQISTSLLFMHFPNYVCLARVRFQLRRKGAINTQIGHIDAFYYQLFEREAGERNKVDKWKSTHRGTGNLRKLQTLTQFIVYNKQQTSKNIYANCKQKCKSTQRRGRNLRNFPKKIYPVKGRSTQIANLDSVPKVLPLSTTANYCCWPTAQIMPRLCTNHAKIMHKSGVSTMCPICTLTDENESMQSLSITVISFSLSINKGDVPRVYVPQTVFWKRQI